MSAKFNFTCGLIFLIHGDSEKIGFHFSLSEIYNGSLIEMTSNLENRPKTVPPSFMISRWVLVIFTRYGVIDTSVFYFLRVIWANS